MLHVNDTILQRSNRIFLSICTTLHVHIFVSPSNPPPKVTAVQPTPRGLVHRNTIVYPPMILRGAGGTFAHIHLWF